VRDGVRLGGGVRVVDDDGFPSSCVVHLPPDAELLLGRVECWLEGRGTGRLGSSWRLKPLGGRSLPGRGRRSQPQVLVPGGRRGPWGPPILSLQGARDYSAQ